MQLKQLTLFLIQGSQLITIKSRDFSLSLYPLLFLECKISFTYILYICLYIRLSNNLSTNKPNRITVFAYYLYLCTYLSISIYLSTYICRLIKNSGLTVFAYQPESQNILDPGLALYQSYLNLGFRNTDLGKHNGITITQNPGLIFKTALNLGFY